MIRRKCIAVLAVAALCLLLPAASCPSATLAKVATVNKNFAAAVAAAQQVEIQLHQPCSAIITTGCAMIDDAEHRILQQDFIVIADCGISVDKALTAGDRAGVGIALQACSSSVNAAIQQGAAGIKNPQAKTAVSSSLLTVQTIVASAMAFAQ